MAVQERSTDPAGLAATETAPAPRAPGAPLRDVGPDEHGSGRAVAAHARPHRSTPYSTSLLVYGARQVRRLLGPARRGPAAAEAVTTGLRTPQRGSDP
ncbi:hypothetical protein [Peterkaempfera sp. SMS 1(5)a]|uniref:hypothetical protein n=1 Tax=Peterkaempfera podocarpi TaxID=3232308 RepID=UPI00366C0545